jgi:hypothetical protein
LSQHTYEINSSVLELPPKIPYFASLFVVANARKHVIGKDILDFTITKVKELLESGDFIKGKLMLRFLAGLTRIIENDGIIQVVEEIVSKIQGQEVNVCLNPRNLLNLGEDGQYSEIGVGYVTIHCSITKETIYGLGLYR